MASQKNPDGTTQSDDVDPHMDLGKECSASENFDLDDNGKAEPYHSLEQMKADHSALLRRRRTGFVNPDEMNIEIKTFIGRGRETGTFLGSDDERYEAQNVLTYWSNILYRLTEQRVNDVLANFELSQSPRLADKDNPYLDLDHPSKKDLSRSAGWQRLIDEAVRSVGKNAVTTLVGAAGGGRTVLIHAGLLPALREDRILPSSGKWEYLPPFTPGKDPLADLARALIPLAGSEIDVATLTIQLFRDPSGKIHQLVAERTQPAVVVVERLEDVLVADPVRVRGFVNVLLALIDEAGPKLRVVLASDPSGLARLKSFGPFVLRLVQGQVLVTFAAAELRQMVVEPAKRVGLLFDDGLIDRLLLDVQGDPAALALLQFTLRRLWDARTGNRITHEAYDQIGGGRLAVSRWAEKIYSTLTPDEQAASKEILLRLIRPMFGVGVFCRRLPLDKLLSEPERNGNRLKVLERLVQGELIVQMDTLPGGQAEYAPVHESLATAWSRFLGWLEDTRERQQWQLRLRAAAEQWRAEGEKPGALWSGAVLELALKESRTLQATGDYLDDLEQAFLNESDSRDRFWKKLRWAGLVLALMTFFLIAFLVVLYYRSSATEAETRRKLATLQTASFQVDEGARSARDLDVSAAFLWYAKAYANFHASADVVKDTKEKERLEASYLLRLGAARQQLPVLAGMAYHPQLLASDRTPDGNAILTVGTSEAGNINPPEIRVCRWSGDHGSLGWKSSTLKWGNNLPGEEQSVAGAYLSPDGRFVILIVEPKESSASSHAIYVWDLFGKEAKVPRELKGYEGQFIDAGFDPDSQFFATVTYLEGQSKVTVWQVRAGDSPMKLDKATTPGVLGRLAFCSIQSSTRLAVVVASEPTAETEDSAVCVEWSLGKRGWDSPPRRYVRKQTGGASSPFPPSEFVTFVTYKPDGSRLLVAHSLRNSHHAAAWLFEAKQDANLAVPVLPAQTLSPPHKGPILHAIFSPATLDNRFLTASEDGSVALWSTSATATPGTRGEDYRSVHTFRHKAQVFKSDFSPDGLYILTASRDRTAMIWNADSGQPVYPSLHHTGSVTDASFVNDGRHVITGSESAFYRWDLSKCEPRPLLLGPMQGVRIASADPDGRLVVTAGERRTRLEQTGLEGWARLWDAATGDPRSPELPHPAAVRHAAVGSAGQSLISTVTIKGEVRLWESNTGRLLWSNKPDGAQAIFTAFGHADGAPHLLVLIREGSLGMSTSSSLRVYALGPDGKPIGRHSEFRYKAPFTRAAISPGCKYAVAYTGDGGGDHGVAVVWDLQSGQTTVLRGFGRRKEEAHDEPITHAAFSPSGDRVVTTSRDDTAVVWTLPDGTGQRLANRPGQAIAGHTADITFASFNRSGTRVVTAGADGAAIVWQIPADSSEVQPKAKLENDRHLTHALFSADEDYIITAGFDGTVRYWDANDGRPLALITQPGSISQIVCHKEDNGQVRVLLLGSHFLTGSPYRGRLGLQRLPGGTELLDWPVRPFVKTWILSPDTLREQESIQEQIVGQATAGRQLTSNDDLTTQLKLLSQSTVYELWSKHQSAPIRAEKRSGEEGAGWHEREAALCELVQHWHEALRHWKLALEDEMAKNRRVVILARRAKAYAELEDWANAEKELSNGLQGASPDADFLRARAYARFRLSMMPNYKGKSTKLQEAISDYHRSLQLDPSDDVARSKLGDAYLESGQVQLAVAEYDQAIQHDPQNPDFLLKRATALTKESNRPRSRAYADYLASARIFKDRRRPDQAMKAYSGALAMLGQGDDPPPAERAQLHAELAEVQAERAELARENDRKKLYLEACKHYERAAELDNSTQKYWSSLARCYGRIGEWENVVTAMDKALKQNKNNLNLLQCRADALIQLRSWEQASESYAEIIKQDPQILGHRLRLAAIYLQAIPPDRPANLGAAVDCLTQASKDFDNESIVWVYLAVVQLASGKLEAYQAIQKKVLELFQNAGPDAANNAAWATSLATATREDSARAMELAEKAVAAFPQSADYLNTRGAALYRVGKYQEAIASLQEATKQRGQRTTSIGRVAIDHAMDLLFQAASEYSLQRTEQAQETLQEAVKEIENFNAQIGREDPNESLARVWDRLQVQILRQEVEKLINKL
jgi:WD40 repeat protein/Tfp pilus assembly protein PilF